GHYRVVAGHDASVAAATAVAVAGQHRHGLLDVGPDQCLGGVHEVAHLAEDPAALPPVGVPVALGHRPGCDPVYQELGRRYPGEGGARGENGRGPAAVEPDHEL